MKGRHIGHFGAIVEDHGIDFSKSGKPFIWVAVRCVTRYTSGSIEKCDMSARGQFWLTSEKAISTAISVLNNVFSMNLTFEQLDMMNSGNLVGKSCDVTLCEEYWGDKSYTTVAFFNKAGEGNSKAGTRQGKKGLNEVRAFLARTMSTDDDGEKKESGSGNGGGKLPF